MKRLLLVFTLFTFFISSPSFLFSQSAFQISYNYDGFDVVSSVKNTAGGYIAAGWGFGSVNLLPVGIAMETNLLGTITWAKRYRGDAFGFTPLSIFDMQKTSAGGYITTGFRGSRALLMNLSSTGTVNWAREIGNNNDGGNNLRQAAAGDFVVAGSTSNKSLNPDKDSTSIFVFKSNSAGTYQWGRTYTLSSPVFDSHDAAADVTEVSGGGYVFTGYLSENNAGDTTTDILLFKTDASGTLQWMKSFGNLGDSEGGQRILELSNGDLLVAGWTDDVGLGNIFLMRTDASGNFISATAYNVGTFFSPEVNSLVQTSSGEFAVFGWCATASAPLFNYKPYLLKLNSTFGIQFTKHYNSQIGGFFVKGEEATNGGYILGNMVGNVSWDLNLIKTDPNGVSGCNENNYSATSAAYNPPVATITPSVYSVGSSSSFTPSASNIAPTPTVVCSTTPLATSAGSNATICSGSSTVIGGAPTATGGTAPYTYAWTPTTGLSCTNCANPTASPATTTTYTVTVTDGASNSSSSTVTVFVNQSPTANAGTGTSICPGASVPIGGSPTASGGTPGYTYAWSPSGSLSAPNVANPTATPGSTTTYTVVVTDANTCTATSQVTVNVFTPPAASISPSSSSICPGDAVTLTASGGGTYLWNTGSTNAVITDSPTTNTTYTVTVTDGNGCTNSTTTSITVTPAPTASISGATTVCSGSSITLTASGGGTYLWNTGSTNASITDNPTTNTSYTVTVSNGSCSSTATTSVSVAGIPSAAIAGSTNICLGDVATLTASGGGTYLWNTGATTSVITDNPTSATSYTVVVTNASGCTDSATFTVNVLPPPVASVSGNNTICSGQSTVLSASGGGNYSWNTSATTSSITVSPTTNTTYSVIVSAGSCSDTTSIAVTVNPSPAANISGSTTICLGQTTTLTATGGGTYSWNTGATSASITASPTSAASYTVIVSNGLCDDTAVANVSVNTIPTASVAAGTSTICSGASATLTASGGANYSWSPGGQTTPSIIITPSSSTNYTVTVFNGTCSDDTSVSITVNPSPTASVSATNNSICTGQTATLTASGGGTYAWNPGGQTTNVISVSPTSNTTYTVTVTAANGCTASATSNIAVTAVPNPSVTASGNTICSGEPATLTASGGTTYVWNPAGETSSSIVVSPTSATTYTLTASNGNCSSTTSVTVNVNPSPAASSANVSVNYGSSTTISASASGGTPPYSYLWNTGESTSVISVSPAVTTIYCVTITDANGCSDTACSTVTIDFNCGELFIPNAFSPNNDMKNDYFRPRNICFKSLRLIVYDRWGIKVFETDDINTKGWDGMYKGELGETAVYNYHFTYGLVTGESGVKKGTVSLIR